MDKVIITPGLEPDFHGFQQLVDVCNAQGKHVGVFLPLDTYKKLLANLKIPYSPEELARRQQEQGGTSLQEFWRSVGRS